MIYGSILALKILTGTNIRVIFVPEFLYDDIKNYIAKLYGIQPTDRIFYFTKSALVIYGSILALKILTGTNIRVIFEEYG